MNWFWKKPKVLIDLSRDPNVKVSRSFKRLYELLSKRLEHFQKYPFDFKKAFYVKNREGSFPI